MYKYKCAKCQGEQYSASENKENEPCIYCDSESVILDEKAPEGTAIPKSGAKVNNQDHDTTEQTKMQGMTVKDIVAECNAHYNCGDCGISSFCSKHFMRKPHAWEV